jgi:hypothetical protein
MTNNRIMFFSHGIIYRFCTDIFNLDKIQLFVQIQITCKLINEHIPFSFVSTLLYLFLNSFVQSTFFNSDIFHSRLF